MIKVLVTGANGQLAQCIQEIVQKNKNKKYQYVFVNRAQLNLSDSNLVESFFFTNSFDYCINCAAYTAVDLAETEVEQAFKVNADAVAILAKECKEQGAKFIHISTDYVFDGNNETPYKETDHVNPQSVYGKSKLEGERLALDVNPDGLIIRTAWVYSHYGKNFVKTMLRLMQEKEELSIVNDQIGAPTNALDLAEAIVKIVEQFPSAKGMYHYSNSGKISWYDFANAIKELNSFNTKLNPVPTTSYPTPAKRPKYSLLDTTKIQKDFNIEIPNWKDSLEGYFNQKK